MQRKCMGVSALIVGIAIAAAVLVGCATEQTSVPERTVSIEVHDADGDVVQSEIESTPYEVALADEKLWAGDVEDCDVADIVTGRWWFVDSLTADAGTLEMSLHRGEQACRISVAREDGAIVNAGDKLPITDARGVFAVTSAAAPEDAGTRDVSWQLVVDNATFSEITDSLEQGITVE